MENLAVLGRWLVVAGLLIALIGGVLWLLGRMPGVEQIPGTLRIQWQGFTCVFPILASIVISLVLTLALNLLARWLNR